MLGQVPQGNLASTLDITQGVTIATDLVRL